MQLRGLHHVTAICRDLERTIAFYRDLMGLAIVQDGPSDDDPGTRHVWFGALDGAPGTLLSFMQYAAMPTGVVGVGSTHHFALTVDSRRSRRPGATTCAARAWSAPTSSTAAPSGRSTCATPTGIVEIATREPGFTPGSQAAVSSG